MTAFRFLFMLWVAVFGFGLSASPDSRGPSSKKELRSIENQKTSSRIGIKRVREDGVNLGKLISPFYTWNGAVTVDFGRVALGLYGNSSGWTMYTVGTVTATFGSMTFSGSSEFSVTLDNCTGATVSNSSCSLAFKFEPSSVGTKTATISWPAYVCETIYDENGNPHTTCGNNSVTWYLKGISAEKPPKEEAEACGSRILIDSQTAIESIPIMGTEFSLNYSSAYAPEYISDYNTLGRKAAFNYHGLTVSHQHYLDFDQSKLYRGTGTSEYVKYMDTGSGYLVVSSSGDEVYIFNAAGRHLSTKYFTTGSTKYTFGYDTSFRLTSIADAFGNQTTFTRDGSGNLTQIVAPKGQTTGITLNGSGLVTNVEDPLGGDYALTYKTGTELLETFTKPGGQVTTLTYDANGRLTKDQGNGGNYWNLAVNTSVSGNPIEKTSKLGRKTSVAVSKDLSGYYRTEVRPDGFTRNYSEGYAGTLVDDSPQRKITTASTDDPRFGSLYQYISTNKLKYGSTESEETISKSVTYPGGATPGYFNFSTLTATSTISSRTHTLVFDKSTMTWTATSDEGATRALTINSYEQPTQYKVGNDTAWTYAYNTEGRLTEVTQGTHNTLDFTYNSAGLVSNIENVRGEDTSYTYDLNGRITQITLPDLRVIGYTYDANGNVTGITPPSRPQHAFVFNAFETLSDYQPASIGIGVTKNTTYSYNDDKQLTQITRPDGATVSFSYDSTKGVLDSVTTPDGTYNLIYSSTTQNLIKKKSPSGLRSEFAYKGLLRSEDSLVRASDDYLFGKVSFTFDGAHRRASRTIQGNSSGTTSTISYTYNDDDFATQVGDMSLTYSYPSGRLSTTTIGQISDSRTYDSYGDLETYTATYTPSGGGSPSTLYTYTLTRDAGSRITGKTETIQGVTSVYEYFYDSAGRLTSVKKDGTVTDSFVYDSNSNRTSGVNNGTSFTATYDDQDRILTYNSRTYTFNRNGDLTNIQWNTTQSSQYVYDVMGNLNQFTSTAGTVFDFNSDGLDRRAVKKSSGTVQWRYIYEDQYRVAAQLTSSSTIQKEFVYATRVNVPDYMINSSGIKFRIITDHLGSPRLVVKVTDGTVMQRMDYSTLGEVTNDTSANFQPFGFAGGVYDGSAQFVRFGSRDYDPRAGGRWTTKDPIRFNGGDTNLYGYVLNDPINFVDPEGESLALAGGAAVGFALGYIMGPDLVRFMTDQINRLQNYYQRNRNNGKCPDSPGPAEPPKSMNPYQDSNGPMQRSRNPAVPVNGVG